MTTYKFSTSDLREAVALSASVSEVMRRLGIRPTGGSHSHLSKRIKREGISTKHFSGQAHLRGRASTRKKTPEEIFLVLPEGSPRPRGHQLRRALIESGRAYACALCHLSEWMNQPITLDVDHEDGDWLNNRIENLRFLCPNCHSQTPTFGAPNGIRTRTISAI